MRVGDHAPGHRATRDGLRALGVVLTVAGGLGLLCGVVSFFLGFGLAVATVSGGVVGHVGPPRFFWCAFAGVPLLGVGLALLRTGYAGRIARYHANEYTPVIRDTVNTLAQETRPAQRAVAGVLREPGVTRDLLRCRECGARHTDAANFCNQCGSPLHGAGA